MKRLIMGLVAAAAALGPLALAAGPAQAQRWEHREERWERREDRWERRDGRWDGRGWERRSERWDRGPVREADRRGWDRRRYNGYYYNERWFYGPPPVSYYGKPYYRPGYNAWRRGAYLPPSYRGYVVQDYYRYRLRPPPRGYAWYRVDEDYMLAAIANGLIFDIITGD